MSRGLVRHVFTGLCKLTGETEVRLVKIDYYELGCHRMDRTEEMDLSPGSRSVMIESVGILTNNK